MKALIDGDICIYRVGYTTMEEPVGIACARMNTLIDNIWQRSMCDDFKVYLTSSDKSNYRFDLYPDYKANRKQPKPTWYNELREHLRVEYDAAMIFGQEADDAIGIDHNDDTIICTIDKDLDQLPGKHYDFVKDIHYDISKETAERFFYFQLLAGDRTDNIPGVNGIGPKKAGNALATCSTTEEYEKACLKLYQDVYGEKGYEYLVLYGRLLKIRQREDEPLWVPEHLGELRQKESVAS